MSKIKFDEKVVPGDGNCLFHSIGCSVNLVQNQIRELVSKYILKHKNKKFNGLTLEEWIKMETDMNVDSYARYILKNGEWGGNMDGTQRGSDYVGRTPRHSEFPPGHNATEKAGDAAPTDL